jgi:hypothetical protein
MLPVASGGDPWAGCPAGWQRVMAFCERKGHRKFLGRGWAHRFGDGFPAVAFDPGARCITTTEITHADGGKTFRFACPFRGCEHVPEVREEKLGELLEGLAGLGKVDTLGRVILNVGELP